jgi:lipid-A-disaccharide synthase
VTRLFISTGEVSGDLQGALLIEALKRQSALIGLELDIIALGGDRMAKAGATLLGHTSEIGSMGIFESLRFVLPTFQIQRRAKLYLKQHPPDMAILIDYMSPNIAWCGYFAKFLPHIPLVYYIAPQEWVWSLNSYNTDRVVQTSKVLAIFPEEANYFDQKGAQVSWVGHPLVDRMQTALKREDARTALGISPEQILITLLPASRQQEINYLLPVICEAARQIQMKLPDVRFLIPLALEKYRRPIEQAIQQYGLQATVLSDRVGTQTDAPETSVTLQAIAAADLAITKSGTVNLEIALLNVPQVVLYKVNPATAWVLRHILKFSIPFMSPPNLVLMKAIVPEFMQDAATPENLAQESLHILLQPDRRQAMQAGYQEMQQALGEPGVCDRAAREILQLLAEKEGTGIRDQGSGIRN